MQKIFVFLVCLSLCFSCRKLVQDEFPNFEKATTINSFFAADSIIKVHISETQNLNKSKLEGVNNAQVKLYINDSLCLLPHVENGFYYSELKAKADKKYRCITTQNSIESEASCFVPALPVLQSVELFPNAWLNDEGVPSPSIKMCIANNSDTKLYFEARVFFYENINENNFSAFTDYINVKSVALFTNQSAIGDTLVKTIDFVVDNWSSGDQRNSYILELRALSQSAYKYLKSLELYELGRFPEFGSGTVVPYNLYNNVDNGYGIFAGYSAVFTNLLVEPYDL